MDKTDIEIYLIKQEHRLFFILKNVYDFWGDKRKRKASVLALLWYVIRPSTIAISLVGVFTLFYSKKANEYLEKQMYLSESSRRSSLIIEMSETFNNLSTEYQENDTISPILTARIIALTNNLKPYRYLDMDGNLSAISSSPERGQMLYTLLETNQETKYVSNLLSRCNFSYADLSGIGKINNKELIGILLTKSVWIGNELQFIHFNACHLENVSFSNSNQSSISYELSHLEGTDFSESKLVNVDFSNAFVQGINLSRSSLTRVFLPQVKSLSLLGKNNKSNLEGTKCNPCYVKDEFWLDSLNLKKDNIIGVSEFIKTHKFDGKILRPIKLYNDEYTDLWKITSTKK